MEQNRDDIIIPSAVRPYTEICSTINIISPSNLYILYGIHFGACSRKYHNMKQDIFKYIYLKDKKSDVFHNQI